MAWIKRLCILVVVMWTCCQAQAVQIITDPVDASATSCVWYLDANPPVELPTAAGHICAIDISSILIGPHTADVLIRNAWTQSALSVPLDFVRPGAPPVPTSLTLTSVPASNGVSVLATESFAGSDANPIGGNWVTVTSLDPIKRLSNVAVSANSVFGDGGAYYSPVTPPNDQYVKVVYSSANGGTFNGGPMVRVSTSASTFYFGKFDIGNTSIKIVKRVGGTWTNLTGGVFYSPTNGDVWELRAVGTTISVWLNGTQIDSATDSDIASGRFGIFSSTDIGLSSFEGGDFAVPGAAFRSTIITQSVNRSRTY